MLKTHGRECRRGLVVQAAVRPVMIIVHLPTLCNVFRLIDTDRPCDNGQAPIRLCEESVGLCAQARRVALRTAKVQHLAVLTRKTERQESRKKRKKTKKGNVPYGLAPPPYSLLSLFFVSFG
jgi:hypothetical protein